MSLDHTQKHCSTCGDSVLAQRPGINHILHLLLTIVTGGIWAIVWILVAIFKFGGWRCTQCGRAV